jgi:hypothetical protein
VSGVQFRVSSFKFMLALGCEPDMFGRKELERIGKWAEFQGKTYMR